MSSHKLKAILLNLILSCLPLFTLAAGIQASPARMDISIPNGKTAVSQIIVANPTPDVQLFTVSADDFSDAITAMPESFTLQAGERRSVDIKIDDGKLQNSNGQIFATNISVISRPLADNKVKIGTGIKLPLTVTVTNTPPAQPSTPYRPNIKLLILIVSLALVILGLAVWIIMRNKKTKSQIASK